MFAQPESNLYDEFINWFEPQTSEGRDPSSSGSPYFQSPLHHNYPYDLQTPQGPMYHEEQLPEHFAQFWPPACTPFQDYYTPMLPSSSLTVNEFNTGLDYLDAASRASGSASPITIPGPPLDCLTPNFGTGSETSESDYCPSPEPRIRRTRASTRAKSPRKGKTSDASGSLGPARTTKSISQSRRSPVTKGSPSRPLEKRRNADATPEEEEDIKDLEAKLTEMRKKGSKPKPEDLICPLSRRRDHNGHPVCRYNLQDGRGCAAPRLLDFKRHILTHVSYKHYCEPVEVDKDENRSNCYRLNGKYWVGGCGTLFSRADAVRRHNDTCSYKPY